MNSKALAVGLVVLMSSVGAMAKKHKPTTCNGSLNFASSEVFVDGHGAGASAIEEMISRGEVRGVTLAPRKDQTRFVLEVSDMNVLGEHDIRASMYVDDLMVWRATKSDNDNVPILGYAPRAAEQIIKQWNKDLAACER